MVLSSLSQLLSQLSAVVHGSRALLVTRQSNFTSIFPQCSQLADLSSSLFFHRPSFWYTGCLQCGEYLTWVRTGYSFQVGTGCFGGISTPHLCLVQDPKPKCLYGRDKFKHYCRLIVNLGCFFLSCLAGDAWITCFQPPMPGEISVSWQWGSGLLCSEIPLMPSWWWVWEYLPQPSCLGRGWRAETAPLNQWWSSAVPNIAVNKSNSLFLPTPREPGFYLSTINCGEKHSVSVILLLRGKEYIILIFYLLLWFF